MNCLRKGWPDMNWHVYKRDDPSTHPDIDCPMYVCWTNGERYRFYDARWDNEGKRFMHDWRWIWFEQGDIFYAYVGYIPFIEWECHPIKCNKEDSICEYDDNGYCLCENSCNHQRHAIEYSLGYKRIWKKFGED